MDYEPLPSTPIDLPQERYEQIIDEIEKARKRDDDLCVSCGRFYADGDNGLCSGCEAYQEHEWSFQEGRQ